MHPTHVFAKDPPVPAAHAQKPGGRVPNVGNREKRKVVRRDPEKRRAQNLQAQKKYRDKLRKRLEDLETIAASVAKTRPDSEAPAAAGNGKVMTETALPVTPISHGSSPSPNRDPNTWNVSESVTRSETHGSQAVISEASGSLVHTTAEEPSMDLLVWDPAIFIDPFYLMPNKDTEVSDAGYWYTSYVECGCRIRHVEVRSRKPGSFDTVQLLNIGESSMPADPYANHLRVEMHCIINAMWINSLHIGVSELMFCEDDSLSPFYRPGSGRSAIANGGGGSSSEANEGVVRTVQSIFKTLKPDLRPTKYQITVPHHPCLDIFPFPTLRNNMLRGVVDVDEDELFDDTLRGLICWGSAGVSGKRERNHGATGKASSGSGTPWDSRSWEGKPWFLRKYWTLLGGEDGELVRQSEWWRCMRDEEEDIWSGGWSS